MGDFVWEKREEVLVCFAQIGPGEIRTVTIKSVKQCPWH